MLCLCGVHGVQLVEQSLRTGFFIKKGGRARLFGDRWLLASFKQ